MRVDSRRIDNLLNLVSEAVITKASFNQLAAQTSTELTKFQSIESEFKEKLHNLFDAIPDYMEQAKEGTSAFGASSIGAGAAFGASGLRILSLRISLRRSS